jgi:hypothetical protein
VPGQAVKDVGRSYCRREHDPDRKEPWILAQDRENAITTAPRQFQVEDEQVRHGPAKARQALQAIACRFDLETVGVQQPGIDLTRFAISVSEEYSWHPSSPSMRSALAILGTLRESLRGVSTDLIPNVAVGVVQVRTLPGHDQAFAPVACFPA